MPRGPIGFVRRQISVDHSLRFYEIVVPYENKTKRVAKQLASEVNQTSPNWTIHNKNVWCLNYILRGKEVIQTFKVVTFNFPQ